MKVTNETRRLRKAIADTGWSLTEFADKLRVARQTLHRWRGGIRQPHVAFVEMAERIRDDELRPGR